MDNVMTLIYTKEEIIKMIVEHTEANYCYGDERAVINKDMNYMPSDVRVIITERTQDDETTDVTPDS
jgi:hypothetical protein